MDHEHALQQGDLTASLAGIQDIIRAHPAEVKHRIFLFQLLAVLGSWERALKQLDVIAKLDDGALALVHTYRAVIQCERFREAVFNGDKDPVFAGQPEQWQALMLQALKVEAANKNAEAQALRQQALEQAPMLSGTINGEAFAWLADADSRMGPMLEVILDGRYLWLAWSDVAGLQIEQPEDLRDVVWIPAHLNWQAGGESYVLIPARYPFSSLQDSAIALSRKTEWEQKGAESYIGHGQRMLVTDQQDYPLLEAREIRFGEHERAVA